MRPPLGRRSVQAPEPLVSVALLLWPGPCALTGVTSLAKPNSARTLRPGGGEGLRCHPSRLCFPLGSAGNLIGRVPAGIGDLGQLFQEALAFFWGEDGQNV